MLSKLSSLGFFLGLAFLFIISIASVYFDLHERRIPNWLLSMGLAGSATVAASGGMPMLLLALSGLVVSLAVFLPVYLAGWLGAGDVKLLSVVGAFLGVEQLLSAWVFIALAGGGLSLLYLYLSRLGWVDARVPYAFAILIGVVAHLIFYFD